MSINTKPKFVDFKVISLRKSAGENPLAFIRQRDSGVFVYLVDNYDLSWNVESRATPFERLRSNSEKNERA